MDAIDRAHRKTLVAAAAEFRDDHHVSTVIEDRPKVGRAVPQAGIAVDAVEHVDQQRGILPFGISLASFDALVSRRGFSTHQHNLRSAGRGVECQTSK